ncbi:pyruvate, phosphate dikinase [Tsukamurella soli]|uniref:Pyruvate, orthophosphate dikinase n=1 Tax=Tsukamurella soli TaxID=644556 RepID=A0ABP8J9W0_9ACTN
MSTSTSELVVGFRAAETSDRALLGGKGSGLVDMTRLGIPVPPGFVLTTACGLRHREAGSLPTEAQAAVQAHLAVLEREIGRRFGDLDDPLLVSVRSGAPVSMPGMMDTILNVGLTPDSVARLASATGDARFAYSSFEHLLSGFATSVRELPPDLVDDAVEGLDRDTAEGARQRCTALLATIEAETGSRFPAPEGQLTEAIAAVFASWDSRRARAYRRHKGIDDSIGTAVVVQAMVYGNRSDTSGSGVAFTRDPASGAPGACGEYLPRAQGEDVVSGRFESRGLGALAVTLPRTHAELAAVLDRLERHATDMCDVEFTVESEKVWILQTRVGQRSSRAAVRIAVDLAREGIISTAEAVRRIDERALARLPRTADPAPDRDALIARGIASSCGAATGLAVFDADAAAEYAAQGRRVVLIRPTTSPSDMSGLIASAAVVTGRGGPMSHAAVVARGMDRPAVCGVGPIEISADGRTATVDGRSVHVGEAITVDGDNGWLARGELELVDAEDDPDYHRYLQWRHELHDTDEEQP